MGNKRKLLLIGSVVVMLALAFVLWTHYINRDLPGKVIGPNPNNIPEGKLPICNFTGSGFVEEPCYSPPDSVYF